MLKWCDTGAEIRQGVSADPHQQKAGALRRYGEYTGRLLAFSVSCCLTRDPFSHLPASSFVYSFFSSFPALSFFPITTFSSAFFLPYHYFSFLIPSFPSVSLYSLLDQFELPVMMGWLVNTGVLSCVLKEHPSFAPLF